MIQVLRTVGGGKVKANRASTISTRKKQYFFVRTALSCEKLTSGADHFFNSSVLQVLYDACLHVPISDL